MIKARLANQPGFYHANPELILVILMKALICLWFMLLSVDAGADKNAPVAQTWVVEKNSTLVIEGSSNINSFTCDVKEYIKQDTLVFLQEEKGKRVVFYRNAITIDVSQFDCHHKFITSDLRKTLKFPQYPVMKIHFISLDNPAYAMPGQVIKGTLDIELAGVTRRMNFDYHVKNSSEKIIHMLGSQLMGFSDFKLEPPKKMAGLIRINEEIKVHVELYFRRIG